MLDLNFIRKNPELVKKNTKRRGMDSKRTDVDKLLALDKKRRELLQDLESVNKQKNELASKFATSIDKEALKKEGIKLKETAQEISKALKEHKKEINEILSWIPNILSEDTPDGKNEEDNAEIKKWPDKLPEFSFKLKDHVELGKKLDLIDIEQSAKVSGSRFYYFKNEASLLEFALAGKLLTELLKRGFTPMSPPLLVKKRALFGTSHLPEGEDQIYKISTEGVEDKNQLYLIGSSEPSNFAYFMDKTLNEKDLPKKICANTTCFRTEVGSWGKDVKGIFRVHQFNKLEMNVVCKPKDSDKIFDELLEINEWFLQELKIPYRIVQKCAGDAGYAATHKQYDVEFWSPVQKRYREWGTCTNATDYQARRLNIKYTAKGSKKEYVHTVNNTGVAIPRTIMAILENHQTEDGAVEMPEALASFKGAGTG